MALRCGEEGPAPYPSWLSAAPPELGARRERGQAGPEDAAVDSGDEQGRAEAKGGHAGLRRIRSARPVRSQHGLSGWAPNSGGRSPTASLGYGGAPLAWPPAGAGSFERETVHSRWAWMSSSYGPKVTGAHAPPLVWPRVDPRSLARPLWRSPELESSRRPTRARCPRIAHLGGQAE